MTECNAETMDSGQDCTVTIPVDSSAAQGEPAAVVSDPAVTGVWKLGTELSTNTSTPVVVHTELPVAQVASASFAGALLGVLLAAAVVAVLRRRRAHPLPDGGQRAAVQTADDTSPSPTKEEN
ncbi:hypothetical protein I3U40_18205 [Mycobacteroides abscessus subsp. abscessus]|uniref:hypothetical protein n=1 Tax=Mycobacteroides abscessus TaxID=36809 RepID=UPI0009A87A88|nr:hypothetical protein [Mycobacteroides abscessus]QSM92990.1 hypothetical protein I3U31_18195 [Mycobacteroides abscessus subsp. abscessus]QSM98028.1 hypothetical protein I3U40_18205 [Mycobacteroides abscessus subsp. abscessus]SLI40942.1 Uncharacterised protein [Mycobacteroides abscessus subsp. abscessus]